ncbi:MAG: 50S ribosomal protein L22 [Parcubacteria group bacterium]|nr:50S ribosomal protein L22 [Parcubacteria group bacterium]
MKKTESQVKRETARLNYLRIAPRKTRLIAGLIKGLSVNEAEAQLLFKTNRAAKPLLKLLRSAASNAKNNRKMNPEGLIVESVTVDKGPMLKRYLPRARGSASPLQKKMSHITLTLVESAKTAAPRFKIAAASKLGGKSGKKTGKEKRRAEEKKREAAKEQPASGVKKELREKQGAYPPSSPGIFKKFFRRKSV